MQLHEIAWSGLTRRKSRFGFMLAGVVLALGTVVALAALSQAMRAEVGDELDRLGANIVVTPRARSVELEYGAVSLGEVTVDARELRIEDAARIRTIHHHRNLNAVAPRLIGSTIVDGARLLLVGATLRQERLVKRWWEVAGRLPETADEALLGAEAAATLHKGIGAGIDVGGRPLRVVGVLAQTGTLDDQAVLADLPVVQAVLDRPGAITLIEVSALCRGCPIADIVAQIAATLPHARVAPIRQAVAAREEAVAQFTRFASLVSAVVLVVGALVVLTTSMAAVTERTREIGVMRAIGFRQRQIATILLLESLAVTAVGGLGGWVVGMLAARYAGPALGGLSALVPWDVRLGLLSMGLAIALGVVGTFHPARRAARLDPADSLRHI